MPRLRVLLFATAREAVGQSELEVPYRRGQTLAEVLAEVVAAHPRLRPHLRHRLALDGEFLEQPASAVILSSQKEVAILPPFSGG